MIRRDVKIGKWSQAGVPHKGWRCVDTYDSCEDGDELHKTCEMCEARQIRFVHTMEHSDFPETLECGCVCVCAGHMESDYVAAKGREKPLRLKADRRKQRLAATAVDRLNICPNGIILHHYERKLAARSKAAKKDGDKIAPHVALHKEILDAIDELERAERLAAIEQDRTSVDERKEQGRQREIDRAQHILDNPDFHWNRGRNGKLYIKGIWPRLFHQSARLLVHGFDVP